MTAILSDKRRCQHAVLPAVVYALMTDAAKMTSKQEEKDLYSKVGQIADKVCWAYANNWKLVKRTSRALHKILNLFVDSRDGKYHIRKVMLALHGATQIVLDEDLITNDVALVVQDALNLEGMMTINDDDWLKLKASADKKIDDIVNIIREA